VPHPSLFEGWDFNGRFNWSLWLPKSNRSPEHTDDLGHPSFSQRTRKGWGTRTKYRGKLQLYFFGKSGPPAQRLNNAAGVTSSGQATDEHGNKLGPSGKPQVNETSSTTREAARNNALNEGSGAVEHSNPQEGNPHFQPADNQGNKKPSSTHHNYPE
jgi:hypothetical protein